jgi:chorismate dehydratase
MLTDSDAAVLIGDPALRLAVSNPKSKIQNLRSYDLAELWRSHTGLGFVFAMWMTRMDSCPIDFAAARDEGLAHVDAIISNYESEISLSREEMRQYLTENISYSVDESMRAGMELYYELAHKHQLIGENKTLEFVEPII